MTNEIIVERVDNVARIQLNRPDRRNALSAEIKAVFERIVPDIVADKTVRALLLTGSGKAFCSGSDLNSWSERSPAQIRARLQCSHGWIKLLASCDIPIVTAVNGMASGAGLGLAMLGDIVIAAEDARFQAGFPRVGAAPDYGIAYTLPRVVGINRAKDILMTNRVVDAEEALAIGLVSRVVPTENLNEEALALAQSLAQGPPLSLGLTKSLLRAASGASIDQFLDTEAASQAVAIASEDFGEGVDAFLNRRQPLFKGS